MNRLTITIESKGRSDATLIPMHVARLRDFLNSWDDEVSKPKGEALFDYDAIKLSWKVQRGVKNTF